MSVTDPNIAQFLAGVEHVSTHLKGEFMKLQTGRANSALVENVTVEAYGQMQPLKNVAGITVQDSRTIAIQPWDKSVMQAVEKALQIANLGTNPVNDGVLIRMTLPPMTEERRKKLAALVHTLSEDARIAIRKHRQTAHDAIKAEKDEDVRRTAQDALQKAVDDANASIADLAKRKEEEIMKV
jgi:ribosome recycling factor